MTPEFVFTLPTEKVPKKTESPENLIIYGKPKSGKTTKLAELDDCLIIDLENGTNKIDALKVQVNSLQDLSKLITAMKRSEKKYRYVAIDTITRLEEWCEWDATWMYMKSLQGKNFNRYPDKFESDGGLTPLPRSQWESVLSLPKGAGYLWLRNSFNKWKSLLKDLAPHVIFVAHVKDSSLEVKGKEVACRDIDLTGKLKTITAADADGIGYVYWEEGVQMISFVTKDGAEAGTRCPHLAGKSMPFDWKEIFIDMTK